MGGERQSLIEVELARTEFRLDVLKLRQQLAAVGVRRPHDAHESGQAVVTTMEGTVVEPATGTTPAPQRVSGPANSP